MKKHKLTYLAIAVFRFGGCFALWNEELGFAGIWFAVSEIINVIDKSSK